MPSAKSLTTLAWSALGGGHTKKPDLTLEAVAVYGRSTVPGREEEVEPFIRSYYRHVDPADLRARRVEDLFGAAVHHVRLSNEWTPGTTTISIFNAEFESHGWASDHTVVMVVVDDMSFLLDSLVMELNRQGIGMHFLVHPVLLDHRHANSAFVEPNEHPDSTAPAASFIAVEIDRRTDPDAIAELEANIRRVLGDVRLVNEDWAAMRRQALEIANSLATETNPTDPENTAEVRALIAWLADDHFTFIGYRDYAMTKQDGDIVLNVVPNTGLGILRQNANTVMSRSFSALPKAAQDRVYAPLLLNLTKANSIATVHRSLPLDYVGVKIFDADGNVTGERRFLGLFTRAVYSGSVTDIPFVRRKVKWVANRSGYPAGGHAEKDLLAALENYPRAELFQIEQEQLFEIAMSVVLLNERRRVRLFLRHDPFGRFVTALLFVPRDRYSTLVRENVHGLVGAALDGLVVDWSLRVSESVLARLFFVVQTKPGALPDVDTEEIESRITELIAEWDDGLRSELVTALGENPGLSRFAEWRAAFPHGYKDEFSPRTAVADLERLVGLEPDGFEVSVYREQHQPPGRFKAKMFRRGEPLSLTGVMPMLAHAGVTVHSEHPFGFRLPGGETVWVYDFELSCEAADLEFGRLASLFERLIEAVWRGEVEDDGYNELALAAGLPKGRVRLLRALSRYLRQLGIPFSERYLQATLVGHPAIARAIVNLFLARFDPNLTDEERRVEERTTAIGAAIEEVASLDEDRILRRFHNLVMAILRTNYFHRRPDGTTSPYLAFKFDPVLVDEMPLPRPRFEIYVYSTRFEAVHLRAGPVSRGGIRWSERKDDFRTEVLGLVKAQMVKNAVIVPSGAKGGFVVKRPPVGDRAALLDEVRACYSLFISAMLDLTDNQVGPDVLPADMVRYDGDDPYLVVAADKGTASFSDTANAIAIEHDFWLGDAFASGGAHGYDHKQMGITARGAWESVKRHFRELGRDAQTEPFTAAGIGDMSGDVFGNGMLLSPELRLVAAFDHRHVFLDPDPDAAVSLAERRRLFELPQSSWADYDTSLLSRGGGVFGRSEKEIAVGDEVAAALGIAPGPLAPNELIRAVLRAPVDLLWNGGIGTYVKASDEPDLDVGDKANEGVRVDACDLRCRIIGEGGNLGFTQRGRIEFAQNGGHVYTDAIDNSGGVECSDHEVNIKILLNHIVASGDLTAKQRNELLEAMTTDVGVKVLADNYSQTQTIALGRRDSPGMVDVHIRYLAALERDGWLNRELEFLPSSDEMSERRIAAFGLTSPELAVVLAYTKNRLSAELLDSAAVDDPYFLDELQAYFPAVLGDRFAAEIAQHPLRREIIASRITNAVVDRGGMTMVFRLGEETVATPAEIAMAHRVAWDILDLETIWAQVATLDGQVKTTTQIAILLDIRRLAERATRWILQNRRIPIQATALVEELTSGIAAVHDNIAGLLVGADLDTYTEAIDRWVALAVPLDLAERAASLEPAIAAFDIVDIARQIGAPNLEVAAVHFAVADRLGLVWVRERILALPRDDRWSTLARLTLRGDLYLAHRQLTLQVSEAGADDLNPEDRVADWAASRSDALSRYERVLSEIRALANADVPTLLVVSREVRNLIRRGDQD